LKLTACGGAARVRHRSIHRDRPALPSREADRSGAGEYRRLACSPLSPKLARGKVRQGAKALRNGSSAITRQSSELAAESGGVDRVRPRVADRHRSTKEGNTHMTVTDFALHHVVAFMIALASLGNPQGQQSYVIEEIHEGAKPQIIRAIRTPAGYEITTVENRVETREKADGRGVLASEKVESTITATTTIASAADDTKFVVRSVERGEYGESPVDLADVFSNLEEAKLAQDGKHVLKCREAEVEVERKADKVMVRQRGKKWSFTIRPIEDEEKAGVTDSQSGNVEQGNAADSR